MKKITMILFTLSCISLSAADIQKLVWPPQPDEARIEYVTSVTQPKDLGIEKGFFSKAFEFVFGEENQRLSSPFGIYADDNRVYVTDVYLKTVNIYDKKDNENIIIKGSKKEKFIYPIDVVSDSLGNIFVSDSVRAKIYVFNKNGDFKQTISSKLFKRPVGIAISSDDKKLYIVDTLADQIHITTLNGKYINSIGKRGTGRGEFNRPTFIDVGNSGSIYISDSMNHRVQILDKNGKYINSFGRLGQSIGSFANPRGISVDSDENIYVSDTLFNTVQIFNKDGEVLMSFGSYGPGRGEFALVEDISITKDNTIYISDVNNKCFKVFKRLDLDQKRSSK